MGEAEQSLSFQLSDEGMGLFERAGLAALYMTLRAAGEQRITLGTLRWNESDLKADAVTIRWTGPAKLALGKLFEFAWQVRDGVLYMPAVHGRRELSNFHLRVPTHNGIMKTFLQHPNVQPKHQLVTRVVNLDESRQITVRYEPPAERVDDVERGINSNTNRLHKMKAVSSQVTPHRDSAELFDTNGELS